MEEGEIKIKFLAWAWRVNPSTETGNTEQFREEIIYSFWVWWVGFAYETYEWKMCITQKEKWTRDSDLEISILRPVSKDSFQEKSAGVGEWGQKCRKSPWQGRSLRRLKKESASEVRENQESTTPWKPEMKCSRKEGIVYSTECFKEVTLSWHWIVHIELSKALASHPARAGLME